VSALRAAAGEYLAMRRALGFKLTTQGQRLMSFVAFCEEHGADHVTADLAIEWATRTGRASSDEIYQARRLDTVRIFARHLQALDPATEVPPEDVLSRRQGRVPPYLYSPQEVAELMSAADGLAPPLRAATWQTLIGLLAVTGMRQGEACRLGRDDADLETGTLVIRDSKFGKSRQVFLHPTAISALRGYQQARDRAFPEPKACTFLVNSHGGPLDGGNIQHTFAALVAAAGIQAPPRQRAPRLHDLFHRRDHAGLLPRRQERAGPAPAAVHLARPRRPEIDLLVPAGRPRTPRPRGRQARAGRQVGGPVTDLAPILQGFFTDRLARQKKASPNTVAAYRDTCKLLLAFARETTGKQPSQLSLADLDAPRIGAFLQHLEEQRGNGSATRNTRLAAIHSLFRYAALRAPEHATVISQVLAIPPRRRDRAIVSYLTSEEADALIAAPDRTTWLGRRDHALLLLAVQTGLRVSELTGLTVGDVHLGTGPHIRCHGKGRKDRATPLTSLTVKVLRVWLAEHHPGPAGPLFPARAGGPLSRDAVERLVAKHAAAAAGSCPSIKDKNVTPHTLRHSAAMALLRSGTDTSVIALWLGHEDAETTQIYLHEGSGIASDGRGLPGSAAMQAA
jgi:integrase/recombinase XerD